MYGPWTVVGIFVLIIIVSGVVLAIEMHRDAKANKKRSAMMWQEWGD